jgi:hypothetical protein
VYELLAALQSDRLAVYGRYICTVIMKDPLFALTSSGVAKKLVLWSDEIGWGWQDLKR